MSETCSTTPIEGQYINHFGIYRPSVSFSIIFFG